MRNVSLVLIGATLAGCSTYPPPPRAAHAEAHLQSMLAGKVAGPAARCIPSHAADNMIVVDDRTLLFRDGSRRVWRNDLEGACHGLRNGGTLVTRREVGSSSLCGGDISHVIVSGGMVTSSCVMGDFVPYTAPGA